MAKIFISYSRKDIEFAKRLTGELQKSDLDFWVDWEGIPPTVDWMKQIQKGIEEADTFIFILSPDSIQSKICKEEIEHAVKNGKRMIPIVAREIKGEDAPHELSHLNWIFFRESDNFKTALTNLLTAIQTDYEWAQAHQRLQVKALEWERNNHENSFLLRGKDLQDAELQLATNTSKEPHPTDLQREHVLRSRQAADRQRRITTGISVAGIIALAALAVFGFLQAGLATANAADAKKQASVAMTAQANAEIEQKKAETAQALAEKESRNANSGRLALESKSTLNDYPQRALLLALEAVRINEDAKEPVRADAEESLRLAIERVSGIGLIGFKHEVSLVQFTNDGKWLVTSTVFGEGEIKIWNFKKLLSDPAYQPFYASFPIDYTESAYLSPQTSWLVVAKPEKTQVWPVDSESEKREPLTFEGSLEFANLVDDRDILEKQAGKVVVWRINPENLSKKELATFKGSFAAFSDDHKYLITDDLQQGLLLWNFSSPAAPITVLTPQHVSDFRSILIAPNNTWVILLENVPHEDIQIPAYDEMMGESIVTKPWESTNIVLIPLGQRNPQQYEIELDMAIDTEYLRPKFSPDGNTMVYEGDQPPDAIGNPRQSLGMLKFVELEYVNRTAPLNNYSISEWSFINKDWFYLNGYDGNSGNYTNKLLDLKQNDLLPGIDLPLTALLNNKGEITFSDDGNYILTTTGELINFHQLDFNHSIVIEPAQQASASGSLKSLPFLLIDDPQAAGLENIVTKTAQNPDGQWLAAGTRDGSLRLWNNSNPWEASSIRLATQASYIALSNDNQWMATTDTLWQLKDGRPGMHYEFGNETLFNQLAVFSPDNHWLALLQEVENNADYAQGLLLNLKLIDLTRLASDGEFKAAVISEESGAYGTIMFSPGSRWLMYREDLYTDDEPASFIYDLENSKNYPLSSHLGDFSFTADQQHVVLIDAEYKSTDGTVVWQNPGIWSLPASGKNRLEKIGAIDTTGTPLLSRNGRWLVATPQIQDDAIADSLSKLWDLNCIIENYECRPFALSASSAAFNINSQYLIAGYYKTSDDGDPLNYDLWDLQNWDQNNVPIKVYSNKTQQYSPFVSQDGNTIIFGRWVESFMNPAGLFSTWSGYNNLGRNVTTFDGYGHLFFGGGGGGGGSAGSFQKDYNVEALTLEDITTSSLASPILLRGHESNISASQISPNEKFVLTYSGASTDDGGDAERLLRLWDMEKMRLDPATKAVILPLDLGTDGDIKVLAFSPDSRWVYVVDNTNTLHYFPTSVEDLKKQACFAVGRNFIINEWQRFFPNAEYRKTCENLPEHPSAVAQ